MSDEKLKRKIVNLRREISVLHGKLRLAEKRIVALQEINTELGNKFKELKEGKKDE